MLFHNGLWTELENRATAVIHHLNLDTSTQFMPAATHTM